MEEGEHSSYVPSVVERYFPWRPADLNCQARLNNFTDSAASPWKFDLTCGETARVARYEVMPRHLDCLITDYSQ
jgi:hypothetical protein